MIRIFVAALLLAGLAGCQSLDNRPALPLCESDCTVIITNEGTNQERGGNSPTTTPNVDLSPL